MPVALPKAQLFPENSIAEKQHIDSRTISLDEVDTCSITYVDKQSKRKAAKLSKQ